MHLLGVERGEQDQLVGAGIAVLPHDVDVDRAQERAHADGQRRDVATVVTHHRVERSRSFPELLGVEVERVPPLPVAHATRRSAASL